ncbi:MAG: aminotransferase class I/II-fold pyridoxal phosphate-dependent enzyme, partial [Anaerovoracaceae bacterium]
IATLPDMRERTLVVKSTSKQFSMTGWRIGYILGPENAIKYLNKVHQNFSTCATAFAQWGAVEAFKNGDAFIRNMVAEFERRGTVLYEALSSTEGIRVKKPKGAFYAMPNRRSRNRRRVLQLSHGRNGVVGVRAALSENTERTYKADMQVWNIREAGEKLSLR